MEPTIFVSQAGCGAALRDRSVRAFDTRTGEPRWTFDPIPRNPGDPAAAGWDPVALEKTGGANVWTMMSVDEERGLIFLPTATAGPNFSWVLATRSARVDVLASPASAPASLPASISGATSSSWSCGL